MSELASESWAPSVDLPAWVHTPEGLGAGDTVGEIRAAYPWALDYRGCVVADIIEAGRSARYTFDTVEAVPGDGQPIPDFFVVGLLRLESHPGDCAPAR